MINNMTILNIDKIKKILIVLVMLVTNILGAQAYTVNELLDKGKQAYYQENYALALKFLFAYQLKNESHLKENSYYKKQLQNAIDYSSKKILDDKESLTKLRKENEHLRTTLRNCRQAGVDAVLRSDDEYIPPGLLERPTNLFPKNGVVLNHYPRKTQLRWKKVRGAERYTVEIDCYGCCTRGWCSDVGKEYLIIENLKTPTYNFNFVGAQPGRWRVWATDKYGNKSLKSKWWVFEYTR